MTSYTHEERWDGFGSQYETIINTIVVCFENNMVYKYSPLKTVEHNYENDPNYTVQLENLMNLRENVEMRDDTTQPIKFGEIILKEFERHMDKHCNNDAMKFIKRCFWENKDRDYYKNQKINIAVHIRRENIMDKGQCGKRGTTPNEYFLKIMEQIRQKHLGKDVAFHIYSQGDPSNFKILEGEDVVFHLDEHITTTFVGLVAADELIISPSSFSYTAALLSEGIVYYKPFWVIPKSGWIVCE